ncbi:aldo-keto reductase superfamily protein [Saccharomycopsis crataegensis]|uniref:Aldo-keto reductase superfamily protein n=1 Tax=Saccharomycopsis crataegensis TaxID=43959 RepID=A0AAV5QNN8_9ASCO|nr:aldo-keto reductase superfamily protein [Saccharomycopsis crataegensis]
MSVEKFITLSSGYKIPTVALGTYMNSRPQNIVYEALKCGYRHFDTAVLYDNEADVGEGILKWVKEDPINNRREEVFYTTKLWNSECGYSNAKIAIKRCLERVKGLEYIDLLLIHSPLCGPSKRLETWKAMQEAVDEGIVRSIGVSNYGAHHIDQLLKWDGLKYKPVVNQIEISPWIMRTKLANYCRLKGIEVESYAPFNHGGRFSDPVLKKIAANHKVTTAQVLTRWNLQKGNIPLPKTNTIGRLAENWDVYSFQLSDSEMNEIDQPNAYEPSDWECTDAP